MYIFKKRSGEKEGQEYSKTTVDFDTIMVFTRCMTTVCRTEDIWAARWMSLSFIEWLTTLNDHGARFRRNTHEIDHTALNENTSRKFPCHVHICVDICVKRKLN